MDPKLAAYFGGFVNAAYSMYKADPANLTPAPKDIPPGYRLVSWIHMSDFGLNSSTPVFYGFIAQKVDDAKTFVLALRGTQGLTEWWDNAHFGLIPFPNMPGYGYVSNGFSTIYGTLKVVDATAAASNRALLEAEPSGSFAEQVARSIGGALAAAAPARELELDGALPGSASLTIAGHSLGAALLTLYVLENEIHGVIPKPDVYTFASPRVGDQTFADKYNGLGLTSWRISNDPDLVPNVPPDIFGYVHVDTNYRVDSTGKVQSTIVCAHAMTTYQSLLDSAISPSPDCLPGQTDLTLMSLRAGALKAAP